MTAYPDPKNREESSRLPDPISRAFPIPFGRSIADSSTLEIIRHAHEIHLPKNWAKQCNWITQKEQEIQRILSEEGESAFNDLPAETNIPSARRKLLKRCVRYGKEVIELTGEAEKALKIRKGLGAGFLYFDEKTMEEYFVRIIQVRNGFLEVGFSWYGTVGPFDTSWRQSLRDKCDELLLQSQQRVLFNDLDRDRRQRVQRLLRHVQILEDGRQIMEAVVGQFSRQGSNPVCIPAEVLRVLLGREKDRNWKSRIEGGLHALRACTFRINSFGMQKIKGYGSFLGAWIYRGAGPGAHGDGDYLLWVQPTFLGCLAIFENGKRQLDSGHEVTTYLFGRKPTSQNRKDCGWDRCREKNGSHTNHSFSGFDAGTVFFNAAEKFSPICQNLIAFLERELTLLKDPVSNKLGVPKLRASQKAKHSDVDAHKPRLYDQTFCPLLNPEMRYNAALGHFRINPESGRTLYGSRNRSSRERPHYHGLISEFGYSLPSGIAHRKRKKIVRKALGDIKAVVVEYFDGVVAALIPGTGWLTLDEVVTLPEDELCKRALFFFFLPETWQKDRVERWEKKMEKRARYGLGKYAWKATEAPNLSISDFKGIPEVPLHWRLHSARVDRGYSLAQFADLFGVSKQAVSAWESGPKPNEDGNANGKPIPVSLVPLIEHWISTNQAPTPEQLKNRKNSRAKSIKDNTDQSSTSHSFNNALCQPPAHQNECASTSCSSNHAQPDFKQNPTNIFSNNRLQGNPVKMKCINNDS